MIPAAAKIRILLVDDHAVFREAVAQVLSAQDDLAVAHCASIASAIEMLVRERFDVVLLDHDLGAERASQFLPAARQAGFHGRVLVVTAWISETELRRLLRQGVSGIFFKERPLAELASSIRMVAGGGASLDPRCAAMAASASSGKERESARRLNARQQEVLRLVVEGLSNKEIGWRLKISESYVKAILQRLFQKMGVRTRGQLVRIALEQDSVSTA